MNDQEALGDAIHTSVELEVLKLNELSNQEKNAVIDIRCQKIRDYCTEKWFQQEGDGIQIEIDTDAGTAIILPPKPKEILLQTLISKIKKIDEPATLKVAKGSFYCTFSKIHLTLGEPTTQSFCTYFWSFTDGKQKGFIWGNELDENNLAHQWFIDGDYTLFLDVFGDINIDWRG